MITEKRTREKDGVLRTCGMDLEPLNESKSDELKELRKLHDLVDEWKFDAMQRWKVNSTTWIINPQVRRMFEQAELIEKKF